MGGPQVAIFRFALPGQYLLQLKKIDGVQMKGEMAAVVDMSRALLMRCWGWAAGSSTRLICTLENHSTSLTEHTSGN